MRKKKNISWAIQKVIESFNGYFSLIFHNRQTGFGKVVSDELTGAVGHLRQAGAPA